MYSSAGCCAAYERGSRQLNESCVSPPPDFFVYSVEILSVFIPKRTLYGNQGLSVKHPPYFLGGSRVATFDSPPTCRTPLLGGSLLDSAPKKVPCYLGFDAPLEWIEPPFWTRFLWRTAFLMASARRYLSCETDVFFWTSILLYWFVTYQAVN